MFSIDLVVLALVMLVQLEAPYGHLSAPHAVQLDAPRRPTDAAPHVQRVVVEAVQVGHVALVVPR